MRAWLPLPCHTTDAETQQLIKTPAQTCCFKWVLANEKTTEQTSQDYHVKQAALFPLSAPEQLHVFWCVSHTRTIFSFHWRHPNRWSIWSHVIPICLLDFSTFCCTTTWISNGFNRALSPFSGHCRSTFHCSDSCKCFGVDLYQLCSCRDDSFCVFLWVK